ncbi:hypothetical protein C900_00178 [Fulvivirga imtechensis AK7]|uniref:FAD-binding domain-containing protein n=1 Tax=Fulvivirga imtechensis AK7 TaxID=1237149 RepID=L8JM83_9BACT|nr:FAD-dependent monooxygenase [Fulvivirga imtechensis]ELR68634.1 hypothetical protein C900_00178 [Fulvivirga imtechensis AK7]
MNILISGAGIAGLTAAWWLSRQGHQVKVVEVAPDLRDEGYMMDFFGPGYDVAEKMDILDALDHRSYDIGSFHAVDAHGRLKSGFNYHKLISLLDKRYFLLMRGDLVNVLHGQLSSAVDITYGTTIEAIEQTSEDVQVTFKDGDIEKYDLVIGADGIHSKVRELVFGNEQQFQKYLGYHVAALIYNKPIRLPGEGPAFYSVTVPDKQAVLCPLQEGKYASFFIWRTKKYSYMTEEERHGVLKGLFENVGWVIPEVINSVKSDEKLYFDTVSQIRMDRWYDRRVVLIGDAAYCLSLMAGQGASFAMAGAYVLARSLQESDGRLAEALKIYQDFLQPATSEKQRVALRFSNSFVPRNKFSVFLSNLYMKVMFFPPFMGFTKKLFGVDDSRLNLPAGP